MTLSIRSDRLVEVFKIAADNCKLDNRTVLLESDVSLAILAIPKSVIGITCTKLGLTPDMLRSGIANNYYPAIPYSEKMEKLAIQHFSKLPGVLEMALPEHLLFVLSRTKSFSFCIERLGIEPVMFVSELYRRSGKNIDDFPDDLDWIRSLNCN
ncbi:hypothetical protein SH467x_003029 [Pirellulaceae bacterium SH467]